MAQENKALMELMNAVEELIIEPGDAEVKLDTRADQIQVIQCEIGGNTVPFNFDAGTGTLDLPEHLHGQPVKVTYSSTLSDPAVLRRTYQEIRRQEIERQVRDEWNQAWDQSKFMVQHEPVGRRVVLGHAGDGPYRSSEIVQYVEPVEDPWYVRLWSWIRRKLWA